LFSVKEVDYSEWEKYFQLSKNNNILQTWQYGEAKKASSNWSVIRFLIFDDNGEAIALAQFMTRAFPIFGGLARMNRGPILLGVKREVDHESFVIKIISTLMKEFKKRKWRLVLIAPEILESSNSKKSLKKLGLYKLSKPNYASGLIDLKVNDNDILMSFKKKWRYYLRKSLSNNLKISFTSDVNTELNLLLHKYKELQNKNSFTGIPESLVSSLSSQTHKDWSFNLFIAKEDSSLSIDECLGMLVYIKHGDTATYLIGLTENKGKELNVNYSLLWHAILHAKELDCDWFDIGGLDKTTPKGIAHFKKGLNSNLYSLVGEWVYLSIPFFH
jgi:lipid II:glycine glycyltransferase (peptidoglycan interpeptide bridge formation enzyme)